MCCKIFGQWFDIWLETYKVPYIKEYTARTYATVYRLYIKPNLNIEDNLSNINGVILQGYFNNLPPTRQKEAVYCILNDLFNVAHKNGFIERNPMAIIKPYKHKRKEGKAMTMDEQREFLKKVKGTPCEKALLYILYTGCRRGECLHLLWKDIDLDKKTLLIRGTKTELSFRTIPLFKNVEKILTPQVYRRGNPEKRVFMHTADYLSKSIKKLGLSFPLSVKDLRTTFATRAMECGIPDKVISAWLGHSTTKTTQLYYEKTLLEYQHKESEKLSKVY